jgi:DNA-directed RNA polymerase subunit RPC12/RpoP
MKVLTLQWSGEGEIEIKCPKCGFKDVVLVVEHKGKSVSRMVSSKMIAAAKFNILGEVEKEAYSNM